MQERHVSIEQSTGHCVQSAGELNLTIFKLLIRSSSNAPATITSISCRVQGNFVPLQVIRWDDGDRFASNGVELYIPTLPALGQINIDMIFNPHMCSKIPSGNLWDLSGYMELRSALGTLKKWFDVRNIELPEEDFKLLRSV